jgi:membrane protease YdiL (CAAX protease family)
MSDGVLPPPIPITEPEAPKIPLKTEPSGRDLIVAVAIVWCVGVAAQVLAAIGYVAIAVLRSGHAPDIRETPSMLLCFAVLDWIVTLPIVVYFGCWRYRRSFADGFALYGIPRRTAVISVAIGVGGALAAGVVMTLFGTGNALIYRIAVEETPGGGVHMANLFIMFALLVPPLEELYYRGFIFTILRRSLSAKWAIGIVATWFALIHALQLFGEWAGLVVVVIMGIIWTVQRHMHNSLTPSIISHWTYNVCLIVMQELSANSSN